MVRINWFSVSDKIIDHYRKNVFVLNIGPAFHDWFLNETRGRIKYIGDNYYLEFDTKEDLTLYMLKWT